MTKIIKIDCQKRLKKLLKSYQKGQKVKKKKKGAQSCYFFWLNILLCLS